MKKLVKENLYVSKINEDFEEDEDLSVFEDGDEMYNNGKISLWQYEEDDWGVINLQTGAKRTWRLYGNTRCNSVVTPDNKYIAISDENDIMFISTETGESIPRGDDN